EHFDRPSAVGSRARAGGWRALIALKEAECCALAGTDCRPTALRRRVGRPQLKRDPLGCTKGPRQMTAGGGPEVGRRQGVVREGARGPVPTLDEAVVGAPN